MHVGDQGVSGHIMNACITRAGIDQDLVFANPEDVLMIEDDTNSDRMGAQARGVNKTTFGDNHLGTRTLEDNREAEM